MLAARPRGSKNLRRAVDFRQGSFVSLRERRALWLARVFDITADFWMNLQAQHDLSAAAIKSKRALKAIKPLAAA